MKTLINLIIFIIGIFSLVSVSQPAEAKESLHNQDDKKIRIVDVDASKYHDEYDKALASDPWKGFNKAMFKFNDALDQYLVEPLARAYRFAVPEGGRDRISDLFNNLGETANFMNSILQGDVEGMFRAFWRFVINSTFGIGGLHDVAYGFGLEEKDKDFSQTLALYGLGSGPYLMVPVMGPSTPRDLAGSIVDKSTDPSTYIESPGSYIATGVDRINTRERLLDYTDDVKANSFDVYSTYKSGYLQHRKRKVLETLE